MADNPWIMPWNGFQACERHKDCLTNYNSTQPVWAVCSRITEFDGAKACMCDPQYGRTGEACFDVDVHSYAVCLLNIMVLPLHFYIFGYNVMVFRKILRSERFKPSIANGALLFAILFSLFMFFYQVCLLLVTLSHKPNVFLSARRLVSVGVSFSGWTYIYSQGCMLFAWHMVFNATFVNDEHVKSFSTRMLRIVMAAILVGATAAGYITTAQGIYGVSPAMFCIVVYIEAMLYVVASLLIAKKLKSLAVVASVAFQRRLIRRLELMRWTLMCLAIVNVCRATAQLIFVVIYRTHSYTIDKSVILRWTTMMPVVALSFGSVGSWLVGRYVYICKFDETQRVLARRLERRVSRNAQSTNMSQKTEDMTPTQFSSSQLVAV